MRNKNKFKNSFYLIGVIFVVCLCMSCKHLVNNYKHNDNTKLNFKPSKNTQEDNFFINEINQIQNLQLKNTIYFPLDKFYILPMFFESLDAHANFLRNNPLYKIIIEGHTDERGTPEYNIGLGERRAYSVKKYLQSKGVVSNQMDTVSYGKEKPIAFGHTEESYSKNRRVILSY